MPEESTKRTKRQGAEDESAPRDPHEQRGKVPVEYTFTELSFLKRCISKKKLSAFLGSLSDHWKAVFRYYFTDLLVLDLYSRKVKNKLKILSHRRFLYSCIDDPELLLEHKKLNGNIVKNISAGMANFIQKHYSDIVTSLQAKGPSQAGTRVN